MNFLYLIKTVFEFWYFSYFLIYFYYRYILLILLFLCQMTVDEKYILSIKACDLPKGINVKTVFRWRGVGTRMPKRRMHRDGWWAARRRQLATQSVAPARLTTRSTLSLTHTHTHTHAHASSQGMMRESAGAAATLLEHPLSYIQPALKPAQHSQLSSHYLTRNHANQTDFDKGFA